MSFITKVDLSSNRQVIQYPETITVLSGATSFGVTFSALTTGPNLNTTGTTSTISNISSTFSGNSGTTVFMWGNGLMVVAQNSLSAITPSNSGTTQFAGPSFSASSTTTIDGNTVALAYTGASFDLSATTMISLGGGAYSGTLNTNTLTFYSANTLDFTGRTIWADVSGITRTERLILTNVGAGPGIIDIGIDANGFVVNQASDESLKENVITIENALEKVLKLRGVSYNWKDRNSGGDAKRIGFIAQEVKKIVPELVHDDGTYLSVNYKDVVALLVEAIKELVGNPVNSEIKTQTIIAEDNNIELNYNGTHKTSSGGGLILVKGISDQKDAIFVVDENGCWVTNNPIKAASLLLPEYTPVSSDDINGFVGDITRDSNYLYVKVAQNKWKRIKMEDF